MSLIIIIIDYEEDHVSVGGESLMEVSDGKNSITSDGKDRILVSPARNEICVGRQFVVTKTASSYDTTNIFQFSS